MPGLYLIIHNVRSAHNVGSLLRTADGLGVNKVYLSGFTPYPRLGNDPRLPHEANKIHKQIQKTALGAESSVKWQKHRDVSKLIYKLKGQSIKVAALEQTPKSRNLAEYKYHGNIAIVVGSERGGLPAEIIQSCDLVLEIPMLGQKESFNVAVAGAIALYHFRYLA